MIKANCVTPRCRGEHYLTLLGKPHCEKCWEKHCESKFIGEEAIKNG